jgi:predicted HTH transcriptional regulator
MEHYQIERDAIIKLALEATRETSRVDFKREFDPSSTAEFLQLIKDLVAMANSGGGCLIVGIDDDGTPSGANLSGLLSLAGC